MKMTENDAVQCCTFSSKTSRVFAPSFSACDAASNSAFCLRNSPRIAARCAAVASASPLLPFALDWAEPDAAAEEADDDADDDDEADEEDAADDDDEADGCG